MGSQESSQKKETDPTDGSECSPEQLKEDIKKWKELTDDLESMFQNLCERYPEVGRINEASNGLLQSPVKEFLKELNDNARPPIIYLLGRSGHGKSTLLNALSKQTVPDEGHVSTTTASPKVFDVTFPGKGHTWKVVDSRDILDSTHLGGTRNLPVAEQVKKDIENFKPDVILHVIASNEVKTREKDLQFLSQVFKLFKRDDEFPPSIVVLTKTDIIGHTQQWPPIEYPNKQKKIEDLLTYIGKNVLGARECKPLSPNAAYCGLQLVGCKPFLNVIPIATVEEEPIIRWNIEKLSLVIGNNIPRQAWLYFYRGQEHKKTIGDLTAKIVEKFSEMATAMFFFNILRE